ncbi:hypothetical protein PIB30_115628, partial [Stylosanthes scabra]|nr:hypothetical protein [Stylosanthes scabra]
GMSGVLHWSPRLSDSARFMLNSTFVTTASGDCTAVLVPASGCNHGRRVKEHCS